VSTSIGGACLCGAVSFSIAPPYRWFAHCHCSMCRKHHGSLFGTGLGVASAAFQWLEGAGEIVHYRATAAFERPFCRHCGSTVPAVSHDERYWHVPAGLLSGDPGARPRTHIFAASRSPLAEIDDVLPRHAAYPPGIDLPIVETRHPHDAAAVIAGSCLCGSIAFTAAAGPRRLVNCYCSLCRRSRAAAFSSTLLVPSKKFRWTRGTARVRRYALSAVANARAICGAGHDGRRVANAGAICGLHVATEFCSDCGSPVPTVAPESPTALLPAGAIDTPLSPLPAVHLYVGSKAAWCEIADAWPQFTELPPPERFPEFFQ
jgi:hypothetical protein